MKNRLSADLSVTQISNMDVNRISLELLQSYYCVPLVDVSAELGVSLTMLKKVCRKFGIQRWPHRQIRSINNTLQELHEKANMPGADISSLQAQADLLEKKKRLVAKGASSGLQAALRNALFLANPTGIEEDDLVDVKKVAPKLEPKVHSSAGKSKRAQALKAMQAHALVPLAMPKAEPVTRKPATPELPLVASFSGMSVDMSIADIDDALDFHIEDVPVDAFDDLVEPLDAFDAAAAAIAQKTPLPSELDLGDISLPADFDFDDTFMQWEAPAAPQQLPQYMQSGTGYAHQQMYYDTPTSVFAKTRAPPSFEGINFGGSFMYGAYLSQQSFGQYITSL